MNDNNCYAIMRMEKRKSVSSIVAMTLHNSRIRPVKNADANLSCFNKVLVGTARIDNDYRRRLSKVGLAETDIRKNGTRALEFILAFSPCWVRDSSGKYKPDAKVKINQWVRSSLGWLKSAFGDNLINVIVHQDESNIHIHAVVTPIFFNQKKQKNRFNADQVIGTPAKLRALQTSYANAMQPLGLKRGLEQSKATHKTLKQFYAEVHKANQQAPAHGIDTPEVSNHPEVTDLDNSVECVVEELAHEFAKREQDLRAEIAYWQSRCENTARSGMSRPSTSTPRQSNT